MSLLCNNSSKCVVGGEIDFAAQPDGKGPDRAHAILEQRLGCDDVWRYVAVKTGAQDVMASFVGNQQVSLESRQQPTMIEQYRRRVGPGRQQIAATNGADD